MSKPNNDNDRIIVNVTNNITSSNTNTNNNENSNDNKNINTNVYLGRYKVLTWIFGIILIVIFIGFCVEKIQTWINTPSEKAYLNFNGNYNLIQDFHYFSEITKNIEDWAITDIIKIDGRTFGIYTSKLSENLPDTLTIGSASDIYTFLDDNYFKPKRILITNKKYILLAHRSKYKTIIRYERRFTNNYRGEHVKISQQGGQYLGSYYDENNGYAYIYSMSGCRAKIAFNAPLANLINKIRSKKAPMSYILDCSADRTLCDIITSACSEDFYYNYFHWRESETNVTINDFFEFVKNIDAEKNTILTIVKDDKAFLTQELKRE